MGVVLSPGLVLQFGSTVRRVSPWILWETKVTIGNISSDEAAASRPVTNLVNPQTSSYWVATTNADQDITISDLSGMIDAVGIARHNFGTGAIGVSVWGITAESSPDYVEIAEEVLPADDSPILFKFEKDAYTSIQVRLAPTGATIPQAAVLMVGELMVIPTGISPTYTPLQDSPDIELSVGQAQRGEFLGSFVLSSGLSTQTPLVELGDSWYQTYMRPFLAYANRGGTFFWAWAPIVRPDQVGYCWFSRSARSAISRSAPKWTVDMYMSGIAL